MASAGDGKRRQYYSTVDGTHYIYVARLFSLQQSRKNMQRRTHEHTAFSAVMYVLSATEEPRHNMCELLLRILLLLLLALLLLLPLLMIRLPLPLILQ